MAERLDQDTKLPLGTRDAVHLPVISAIYHREKGDWNFDKLQPGTYVKFIDDNFTKFIICERQEAHGFINPCLQTISFYDNVLIFLLPGITTPVRHHFEIDLEKRKYEQEALEEELKEVRANDPACGDCWIIQNNHIIRM